jgi:hypothetical protein
MKESIVHCLLISLRKDPDPTPVPAEHIMAHIIITCAIRDLHRKFFIVCKNIVAYFCSFSQPECEPEQVTRKVIPGKHYRILLYSCPFKCIVGYGIVKDTVFPYIGRAFIAYVDPNVIIFDPVIAETIILNLIAAIIYQVTEEVIVPYHIILNGVISSNAAGRNEDSQAGLGDHAISDEAMGGIIYCDTVITFEYQGVFDQDSRIPGKRYRIVCMVK